MRGKHEEIEWGPYVRLHVPARQLELQFSASYEFRQGAPTAHAC
jgi:hypothetical protein